MKKFVLLSILLLTVVLSQLELFTLAEQTIFTPEAYNPAVVLSADNTIILSDMHKVFMKPIQNRIVGTIWNYENKLDIIRNTDFNTIKTTVQFLLGKFRIITPLTNEEHLIEAAKNAHNDALVDIIIKGGSGFEPMVETVEIYKDLHNQGYQLDLGSNVASSVFASFKKGFPELFDSEQGIFTNYHVVTTTVLRKPNIEYFTSYNKTYNTKNKFVIFVDDKLKNVVAAQKAGMIGIVFLTAEQLQADLQKLGVTTTLGITITNISENAIAIEAEGLNV